MSVSNLAEPNTAAIGRGLNTLVRALRVAVGKSDVLIRQLLVNQLRQNLAVTHALLGNPLLAGQSGADVLHRVHISALVKADADVLGAIGQGQAALEVGQLNVSLRVDGQVNPIRGRNDARLVRRQVAFGAVLRGGGQLAHRVELNIASGLAAGVHAVGERPLGQHLDGAAEKTGGHQVGAGGIGGIFIGEPHHFADNAPVRVLFPFNLGDLLVQLIDFCGIALDQAFYHAFRVQAAGQTADHVRAVHETAYGVAAAAHAAERRHS